MRMLVSLPIIAVALIAAALLGAPPAAAATCNVSPQGVSFGGYDTLSSGSQDGVGNISVTCDAAMSFTVSLGTGAGTYAERSMTSGAEALSYNLYTDASRLIVWGDGSGSTGTVSTTATAADIPVYGRIPARQIVPAGAYTDVIVVTITY